MSYTPLNQFKLNPYGCRIEYILLYEAPHAWTTALQQCTRYPIIHTKMLCYMHKNIIYYVSMSPGYLNFTGGIYKPSVLSVTVLWCDILLLIPCIVLSPSMNSNDNPTHKRTQPKEISEHNSSVIRTECYSVVQYNLTCWQSTLWCDSSCDVWCAMMMWMWQWHKGEDLRDNLEPSLWSAMNISQPPIS